MIPTHSAVYEVTFAGLVLLDEARRAFDGLSVARTERGVTVCGRLPDQAAVHGVLARGQQIGLQLVEMHRLRPEVDAPADQVRLSDRRT